MIRNILFIGVLTMVVHSALGQLDYGVRAGLNHVNVIRKDSPSSNNRQYKQSYHVGGYLSLDLSKKLFTQVELLYSNKGHRFDETNINDKGRGNFHYINLPILMGYRFSDRFRLTLGPELGYLLSSYSRERNRKTDTSHFWDNEFDLGASVGVGMKIIPKLTVDFRYTHGLLSVAKNVNAFPDDVPPEENYRLTYLNHTFQLSLLYSLRP